ncbi:unnamed protein product [Staurois parvus]|uniref:Uncharacterized protein n=1 Tax=Staurois parvus TaxID=386267 RepID=A0ABN9HT11_9NEOB|nr:unnamed protein product [Staurois parvus]
MDRWHSGKTLDRLVWTAGIGVTRHQVIWLEKGSGQRASSGKAEGSEYNWYDRGHWVQTLDRPGWTAGTWVTRHQVTFGYDSGHRVIWQGSGLRSQQAYDSEHRVIRYQGLSGSTAGISGHQASGHLARHSGHRIRYTGSFWINRAGI